MPAKGSFNGTSSSVSISVSISDVVSAFSVVVSWLSAYKILEISKNATNDELKKAYRKMAAKFHPDKVHHLGEEFQKMAEEKFKKLNDAYTQIKKERNIK